MNYDIIIIGGGIVGLTTACALAQQTSFKIAVLEANETKPNPHRVSAISLSSKRIFSALKVWPLIQAKGISPFTRIKVWDGASKTDIEFDSCDIAEPLLGYIIENDVMQSALIEKLSAYPQVEIISPVKLINHQLTSKGIEFTSEDNKKYIAKLAIGADGANSWLRQQFDITTNKFDYEQRGIVATVKTELPHEQTARQVFLPSGPLAFLPLQEPHTSSIVWSVANEQADHLLGLDEGQFKAALSDAFTYLDKVHTVSPRLSFPLYRQQSENYIKERIALVGDAAHVVHPLAGQGVNTGLLDAARLTEVLSAAEKQRRDFASIATLRRYERWSKAENELMFVGIDKIKKIFANPSFAAERIRSLGLTFTNKISLLKNIFIRHAVGNRSGLPELAKSGK